MTGAGENSKERPLFRQEQVKTQKRG